MATTRPEFYYSEDRKQYRKRLKLQDGRTKDLWADTKDELRLLVRQYQDADDRGLKLDDETTLFQFSKEWLPVATAHLSYAGKNDFVNALNVHILPFFGGNMKIKDVKPLHVDKLLLKTAEKIASLQSAILNTLRKMLDSAVENGLIASNPAKGKRAGGKPPDEKTPLTPVQQQALLSAVQDTRVYPFVALGLYAGLRREEILGLAWNDVHLDGDAPYLEVTHAVRFEGNKSTRTKTLKTAAARRKIPMPTPLVDILKEQKGKMISAEIPTNMLIISKKDGSLCTQISFKHLWDLVVRRTKSDEQPETSKHSPKMFMCEKTLDFKVTPHILRHTYITTLCASGMDIKKIQYLVGHSSLEMTLNIYSHVVDNRPEDLHGKIDGIFAQGTQKETEAK